MNLLLKLALFAAIYSIFHAYILRPYIAGGACTSKARMDGKTVIITGANTGIGKETALDLARRGARVVMACRDLKKGEAASKDILKKLGSGNLVVKHLDLASLSSVRAFAEDINKNEARLDVLINNAGVMALPELTKTIDGFETQMAVNHLGHFLLTNLLLGLLKKSTPARIVVVSSMAHWFATKTGLNFENMNGEVFYDGWDAYGQSKLANILFTRELSKRLNGSEITANSLHPGAIATELGRNLPSWMQFFKPVLDAYFKTPAQGAQTNIHLAVSEEVEGVSGLYFADCKEKTPAETAMDDESSKKLWEVSARLVELHSS